MHVDKTSEIKVINITDDEEVIEYIIVECNQFEIVTKSIFVASEKPLTWREKYCKISDISLALGTLEILKFFGNWRNEQNSGIRLKLWTPSQAYQT